ncbi:MAG: clostripain-related cysteine peptidase [Hominilimicola sp.]
MKRMTLIIAAVMTALILASCSSGRVVYEQQTDKLSVTGRSWTVLVYMCGGSEETAHGTASKKLNDIMSVDYPENVNVIVQTGGSSEWHKKGIYSDYTQRFEAGKDTLYLADQAIAADMGDYNTLADFLKWGTSKYKSDNYMLILSGAGGGSVYGMAYDELNGSDYLTLEEISYAMSLSGKNFDIVGFDTSLMGSLETASALSTYASYMVAAQDVQNPNGWDYAGVLQYICDNPSADTSEICKAVCDTYYRRCVKNGDEADAAMSVVDMSKVSALNQAFDGMAGDMLVSTDSMPDYINMANALRRVHIYGGAAEDEGYSNLIDLGDTALKIRDYVGNTADMLIEALNDAVTYRVCGERQQNSTGLSVYYPIYADNDQLQKYMDIAASNKYKEFLRKICVNCSVEDKTANTADYTSSWAWTTYNEEMSWLEYMTILDGNSYELNIAGDMDLFSDVSVNLYQADKESGEYVFVGKYHDLEANWEGGIFKDNFSGRMPRFMSKSVTMRLVRSYEDYDLYAIPVILNGERSSVRVKYDRDRNDYDIIGVWSGMNENGMVSSAIRELGMFDRITPLLAVYDENHKKTEYVTGSLGIKLGGDVSESNIEDGEYIFEYELTDVYGNKRHGTPVKAMASGGKIHFE